MQIFADSLSHDLLSFSLVTTFFLSFSTKEVRNWPVKESHIRTRILQDFSNVFCVTLT